LARLKKTIKPSGPGPEQKKPDPVPAPEYKPQTLVSDASLRILYQELEDHWLEQAEHYGYSDDRPENVTARMQAVLGAVDLETAYRAVQKAKATMQIMILGAWARGRIAGPVTERSLEQRVRRAESLAEMLEKKGEIDAALRQLDRADQLRAQLQEIKEEGR
jgi:hypothetical protein